MRFYLAAKSVSPQVRKTGTIIIWKIGKGTPKSHVRNE